MYPETVGRSLEEVEEIFEQGHVFTAWKISKHVGKKTLADLKHDDNVCYSFTVSTSSQQSSRTITLMTRRSSMRNRVHHHDSCYTNVCTSILNGKDCYCDSLFRGTNRNTPSCSRQGLVRFLTFVALTRFVETLVKHPSEIPPNFLTSACTG